MSNVTKFPRGEKLFDLRPIKLPGWELRHNAAVPIGRPSIDDTAGALEFTSAAHEVSPYWVGDILAHAESRDDWKDKFDQLMTVTGLAEQTLHNLASIARHVDAPVRDAAPSFSHARTVQKLEPKEQLRWMKKAKTEGWQVRELDLELKAAAKRVVARGSADLEGMFRVWYVDCPWLYGQKQPSKTGAQTHYRGMTIEQLVKMGDAVQAHTTKNAVGFFWVTAPLLYENPGPREVIEAWGFTPKTGIVWDKVMHNFGNYVSVRHEHLIIATRGSCTPDRPTPMPDSVVTERRTDLHSEKPAVFRKLIEKLYDGPRVEMFARSQHKGWTAWGDQVNASLKQQAG